ncbi:MAG: 2-succinyl-5-enolpyruvyl-6-hydroxy-3-cyclohexene-1-carboxylic-acid synthase [Candidatus Marinimicrobia bacterium]|nr:2-succinyl-5-enolpyruvyl-6-hydroxy-3-cyclohexene-1-carboxylic-acid synthase [Candidatus Neomarinimicrobiota bacterium]|tara:strand:+ start:8809 stop:10503 length:1695 start_codon:yes stop_codon:yes gene_type:complete
MKNLESNSQKNFVFSKTIISYFVAHGIKYAFISPGSRNTPLTQALLNNKDIKTYSIVDERSSVYVALGKIKSDRLKCPVLIVTTSGTAVANLFPGIVEAYMSKIPIIIITADRPKRLIGTGANQTIYQNKIFGKYAKFFDGSPYIKNLSDQLGGFIKEIYSVAMNVDTEDSLPLPTPVHLNVPFDEPLIQKSNSDNLLVLEKFIKKDSNKIDSYTDMPEIKNFSKMIIVCTDICDIKIIKAAENLHIPIFMECRSLRFGIKSKNIISSYELILKNCNIKPDIILRFGSRPISRALNDFIDKNKTYLIQGYYEKVYDKSSWVNSNEVFKNLNKSKINIDKLWFNKLIKMQKIVENKIQSFFKAPKCHEGYIINTIISTMPKNSNLMIGNSSPIRDLDTFTFNLDKKINIYSNRGASGIDGLISTAIGMSINKKSFNTLIVGDVSFYYDLTALNIAKNIPINLTIFIINNNGGHIFDRLDGLKNQDKTNFEKYWLTPINLDIKSVAKVFDCSYQKINLNQYKKLDLVISQLNTKDKKINLVEIIVNSEKHHSNNEELENKIKKLFN